jgi:hypothetical protein
MEKTRLELANEIAQDQEKDNEVRTLKDLELVLVGGGGDDVVTW